MKQLSDIIDAYPDQVGRAGQGGGAGGGGGDACHGVCGWRGRRGEQHRRFLWSRGLSPWGMLDGNLGGLEQAACIGLCWLGTENHQLS